MSFEVSRLRKIKGGGIVETRGTYTVQPPDNSKRLMIKDAAGIWVDTKPLVIYSNEDNRESGVIEPENEPVEPVCTPKGDMARRSLLRLHYMKRKINRMFNGAIRLRKQYYRLMRELGKRKDTP